jgi:hypothetical protein
LVQLKKTFLHGVNLDALKARFGNAKPQDEFEGFIVKHPKYYNEREVTTADVPVERATSRIVIERRD